MFPFVRRRPVLPPRALLYVERLEDRTVPAMFNVTDVPGLIAAINTANSNGQADTIDLAAGTTFVLSAVDNTTNGANGLPVILADGGNDLTIDGNGDTIERSTASGTPAFRILADNNAGAVLTLDDVTIQNGLAQAPAQGGGIFNGGTLAVTDCTITGNAADATAVNAGEADGGGIFNGGTLAVTNSTFTGNGSGGGASGVATGGAIGSTGMVTVAGSMFTTNAAGLLTGSSAGGAIASSGTATVTDSTFGGNYVDANVSGGAGGGGIASSGTLTVAGSAFAGNFADAAGIAVAGGGGIANNGTLTVGNATFAGNFATAAIGGTEGGGILNNRSLTVTNATFAGNSANAGGGIFNASAATATLTNTLLAQNSGNDYAGGSAASTSANNIIQLDDGSTLTSGVNGNLIGSAVLNVGLDPSGPRNNGGPTQTIALLPGSQAIGAGSDSVLATFPTDQRGITRTAGKVDIGAYQTAITLSPDILPPAGYQTAYDQTLSAAGGTSPYTFAVTFGTLPAGLSLAPDGDLTGMRTDLGVSTFVVAATDANGFAGSQSYTLGFSYADTFANPGPLAAPWTPAIGAFTAAGNQATAAHTAAASMAVLSGVDVADTAESVSVTHLASGQLAALVAHYQGSGDLNMDYGGIQDAHGTVTAVIAHKVNGHLLKLASAKVAGVNPAATNAITLEAIGPSLRLFVNGTLIVAATDATFTTGAIGIRGTHGVNLSSYSVSTVELQDPSLPFTDSFNATPDGQLSTSWLDAGGDFAVNGSGEAVAFSKVPANIAVLGGTGATTADATLSVNVSNLASGQMAALVARYQDDGTMYYAGVHKAHGVVTAEIWRIVNGVRKKLKSAALSSFSGGPISFQVTGTTLQLTVGTTTLQATDSKITAAGGVGIRGTAGTQFSSFGAS